MERKEEKPAFEMDIDGVWFQIWACGRVAVLLEEGRERPKIGIKINRIPQLLAEARK